MRTKPYFDDYAGLETDVLLTSILYDRIIPTWPQMRLLQERIQFLKKLILL